MNNKKNNGNMWEIKKNKTYNDNFNKKKLLCNSIINNLSCKYGDKCLYAHNLSEQNIDKIKKKAYDIIIKNDIYDIDLSKDKELAKTLLQMTKLCKDCDNGNCSGGYNCKNGVMNIKYKICYDDLMYNNCKDNNCSMIHITSKGLKPIINIKNLNFFNKNKFLNNELNNNEMNEKEDKLLKFGDDNEEYNIDNESNNSVDKIREYLDKYDSDEECEETLFG